jgi:hypothetical protein
MAAYMQALLDPERLEKAGVLSVAAFTAMRGPLFGNTTDMGYWRHGFMDFTRAKGRQAFGHGGDVIDQHSTMEIYPDAGIGIFVSVNTPTGLVLRETLPDAFMAAFAGPLSTLPRAPDAKAQAAAVAGSYRSLRLPHFRTERAVLKLFATSEVKAMPNGDIAVPGGGRVERFYPTGGGMWAEVGGPERISFHRVHGRMMRFDPFSAAPAVRIGFFEGVSWLMIVASLGVVTALWGVASGARRAFRAGEAGRAAGWTQDALCLVWLAAFGLTAVGVTTLGDPNTAVFTYPGRLLPIGLWALLVAAFATPLAALALVSPLRPRGWTPWRWARQVSALAVFAGLSLTLWAWGLLGYFGW